MKTKILLRILVLTTSLLVGNSLQAQSSGDYRSVTTTAPGSGAVIAVATSTGGVVSAWTIASGGSGYTDGATVTVTNGANTATFVAIVSGGVITGVTTASVIAGVNAGLNTTPASNTVTVSGAYLWTTAAAWETYNGSDWVAAVAAPATSGATNITIQSGPAILLTAATSCGNLTLNGKLGLISSYSLTVSGNLDYGSTTFYALYTFTVNGTTTIRTGSVFIGGFYTNGNVTIESGGQLRGTTTAGGSVQTLYFNGASPTITINGTLGGTGINVAGEGIRIYMGHSGTATFTGNGTVNIARFQMNSTGTQSTTIDINMNINNNNTQASTTTFSLWGSSANSNAKTLTINANKTVAITRVNGSFHHNTSASFPGAQAGTMTYNINGTLDLTANGSNVPFFLMSSSVTTATNTVTVNVGSTGVIKMGTKVYMQKGASSNNVIVNVADGGTIDASTVAYSSANWSNTNASGNCWFTLSGKTSSVKISAPASATPFWVGTSNASYDPITLTPGAAGIFTVNANQSLFSTSANQRSWKITPAVTTTAAVTLSPSVFSYSSTPVIGVYDGSSWTEQSASYSSGNFTTTSNVSFTASTAQTLATGNSGFTSAGTNPVGIYTAAFSGNFSNASIWTTDALGVVTPAAAPTASNDVLIPTGVTLTLEAPTTVNSFTANGTGNLAGAYALTTASLTVNSSAFAPAGNIIVNGNTTIGAGAVYTTAGLTTNGNADVSGQVKTTTTAGGSVITWILQGASPTVTVNSGGVIGGTGIGVSGEGLRFYLNHTGTATFQGDGTMNIARFHTNSGNTSDQTTNVNINMNINNTASNVQVLTLQNGNNGSGTKTLNIGAGKTVKLTQANGYLHAASGTGGGTNTCGAINYNVYGTLDVSAGQLNLVSNGGSTGNTVAVNVKSGGTLKLGATNNLYTTLAGQTAPAIVPESGSTVEIAGSSAPVFNVGNASGATAPTYPSSYYNLTINNSNGVTLPNSPTVSNTLNLALGTLETGSNTLTLNSTITGSGLINTSTTGTLAFGAASEQTLNAANLTSGAVNNLTVNAGSKLNTTGNITATAINILSSATGTGTLINGGTLTNTNASVQQYLADARNWYVSSPVSKAAAPSGFTYYSYDETGQNLSPVAPATAYWVSVAPGADLNKGVGYIALPSATGSIITFATKTGETLNLGDVDITLTRSGATKIGFNLIGNPYPAHLTWTKTFVDNNAAKIESTIWYRTNAGTVNSNGDAAWSFKTINASTGEASPLGTTNIIPPAQAFWVRAVAAGTLTLNSDLTKSHQASNPLKAPAAQNTDRQRVRLQVSNGTSTDEALIYFDSDALNGYDNFDSPKMSVNSASGPEIYTQVNGQKLVINGMNSITDNLEIPLGLTTGQSNTFTLKATQLSNIGADTQVYLKDNTQVNSLTELVVGQDYTFASDVTTDNISRFSLVFKALTTVTATDLIKNQLVRVFSDESNQIIIEQNVSAENSVAYIYNAVGQLLQQLSLNSAITSSGVTYPYGIYFVTIRRNNTKTTSKLLINNI